MDVLLGSALKKRKKEKGKKKKKAAVDLAGALGQGPGSGQVMGLPCFIGGM